MKRLDKVKDQPVNELFTLSMRIADLESRLNQMEEALAQSEKRLSLIFDSVTDEINLLKVEPGPNYRVETVNKALLQHMGFTGEIIGKRIDELLPKEEYEYIRERFSQAIQTRMPVRYERSFAVLGSQEVFEVDAIPIFDENGEVEFTIRERPYVMMGGRRFGFRLSRNSETISPHCPTSDHPLAKR